MFGDPTARRPNHNPITDGRLRVDGASDWQLVFRSNQMIRPLE
jgi:hypothetical protein